MASRFQQQALQRKLLYAGLILVLFTASWGWRHYAVAGQAEELAIREQSRGDVELTGAVLRLSLTGMRGMATCVLWNSALDKQKKNQWNELELIVRSLTKLQPHFITPWLFQSWNLAYNVSVESDRVGDKFFYITRGINLLAEGERQNRNNPDLRWYVGFYTQHKIGQSDETNTLRSLFQLSCIPPNERDPARFLAGEGQKVKMDELARFCQAHPQLARRLREGLHRERVRDQTNQFTCDRPADVVRFLADNYNVPSLYEDTPKAAPGAWEPKQPRLKAPLERFPVLPPDRPGRKTEPARELILDDPLGDDVSCYTVSAAWYGYALESLPPPAKLPGESEPITDRNRQRLNRFMTTLIFRSYPAQAHRYDAERLQQEGWFDEAPWKITGWFEEEGGEFPGGKEAKVGGGPGKGSLAAWQLAKDFWVKHGEDNHLFFSAGQEAREKTMRDQAAAFRKKYRLSPESPLPQLREESLDETTREQYFAAQYMQNYNMFRTMSNFPHHLTRALVEVKPETVHARKLFYEADRLYRDGRPDRALARYNDPGAIRAWKEKVLRPNKDYRLDPFAQEETYMVQLRFLRVWVLSHGKAVKDERDKMARMLPLIPPLPDRRGRGIAPALVGPFDGTADDNTPWISPQVRMQVLERLHLVAPPKPSGPPPGAPSGPGGPPLRPAPPSPGS